MSDICSAIHDDIQDYIRLCSKYGETVKYTDSCRTEDCYGNHADKLRKRERSEVERSYCLGCRKEAMTESGQLCEGCKKILKEAVESAKKEAKKQRGKNGKR